MTGVAAWLNKPLNIDRFLDAVEHLIAPSRPTLATDKPVAAARVLVFEDEQPIRALIIEHLTSEGFAADPVGTIAEARAHMAAARPSLILLDLMLPGKSGWSFLRQRRVDPALPTIPVLVFSAVPRDQLLEAKDLGADGFLS